MTTPDFARPGRVGRRDVLAEMPQEELIAKWEEFFEEQGYESRIITVADRYPEARSLEVSFEDLNRFDTDMAIYLLRHPLNVLTAGEEAIRRLAPPGEETVQIHLRVKGVPRDRRVQIRDLRAKHLGQFLAVEGLVRKSTEVRPRVVGALFQCLRCGTVLKEEQEDQAFREPLECYEDQGGCGRSASATKFELLTETSLYLDTQKIEIQEAPEGLRGGAEPQRLSAYMEDDLTGRITPGMRVVLSGVLRSAQRGRPGARSTLFDIFLDANSVELEQVEFEDIEVTEEDARKIREIGSSPDIFRLIVNSIAPSIYGMHVEKEALALQLFSGVPKVLPDGRRIRGDLHLLLVGDPGCLVGDERIVLGDGTIAKLRDLGQEHLDTIRTQVRLGVGSYRNAWATRFHRYVNQPILEVTTETGKSIKGTYNHPLLVWDPRLQKSEWRRLDTLRVGDRVRTAPSIKSSKRALIPTTWSEPRSSHRSWHVKTPEFYDEKLAAIMGYIVGEGWVRRQRVGYRVAAGEDDLAPKLRKLFRDVFGFTPRERVDGPLVEYDVRRTPIANWLRELRFKRVPPAILRSRDSVVASFLRWLYEADGSCFANDRGRSAVSFKSSCLELLRDVQALLLRWGIHSSIRWTKALKPLRVRGGWVHRGPSGKLVIRRANSILRFARHIGFVSRAKRSKLRMVVRHARKRAHRRHGQLSERIVSIRRAGRATVFDIEVPGPQHFIANGIISHNTAKSELLSYMSRLSPRGIYATGKAATAAGLTASAVRDEFGEGRWTLEAGALVLADKGLACLHPESTVFYDGEWLPISRLMEGKSVDRAIVGGREIEIRFLEGETLALSPDWQTVRPARVSLVSRRWYAGPIIHLTLASGSELRLTPDHVVLDGSNRRWVRLEAMRPGDCLVVSGKHARRVARGALAGVAATTSGGGEATGVAGESGRAEEVILDRISSLKVETYRGYVYDLQVPRDASFLCGGAVVHNCIDEIEKMNPQDRSAIHEALEQQRISVAKAGITAVLQARCAVLAAANPQFGRFDIHKYISEQIQLEPPLLSRFDGIFALIDRPESEKDRALAEHVLRGHKVGEILRRREEGLSVVGAEALATPYTPHFDPDFFRKYVAYAKRIFPVMTDEAMDAMQRKYLEIRKLGEGAGASVPITPRQLESIIRFAEASARLRLSEAVEIEDVDRSIRVVEYWMGKVAGEEGGRLDIDIIQTGISQSQREQIIALRDIISELAGPEGVADYEDIVRVAQERGVPPARVDAWLKRWSQEGEIYSPAKNKYKLVERL